MMSFTLAQQVEIRTAIEEAVKDALLEGTPNLSIRIGSSALEFSALQPAGMQIGLRMSILINEKDKKESAPD